MKQEEASILKTMYVDGLETASECRDNEVTGFKVNHTTWLTLHYFNQQILELRNVPEGTIITFLSRESKTS